MSILNNTTTYSVDHEINEKAGQFFPNGNVTIKTDNAVFVKYGFNDSWKAASNAGLNDLRLASDEEATELTALAAKHADASKFDKWNVDGTKFTPATPAVSIDDLF